jgi:hypothetical protein
MYHVSASVWNDMRIRTLAERIPRRVAFWALAGVALLVSHDAIFLVQVGPGESLVRLLRQEGHEYWGLASLALAGIGLAVGMRALLHLHRLRQKAAALGLAPDRGAPSGVLASWLRLAAIVSLGFVLQENAEHYLSHMHAPGLAILAGPEYPLALPVIALVSGLAALLASATGGTERAILDAIEAALRQPFGHAPRGMPRPPLRRPAPRISPLARAAAGRAPPPVAPQLS